MTDTTTENVWLITGTSTGFGRHTAEKALKRGDKVIATSRDLDDIEDLGADCPDSICKVSLDVTDPSAIEEAVKKGHKKFGRIDILMNNAGFGMGGSVEETSDSEARKIFDVNFFGLLNVTREVLPIMREQGKGLIVNLSSVVGQSAFAGIGIYSASKFAVEGVTESLKAEIEPFGIKCLLIEPGPFDTEFAGSMTMAEDLMDCYDEMREEATDIEFNGDPEKAAEAIVAAATSSNPPMRLALGDDAIDSIRQKLEVVKDDLDKWEDVTRSTGKDDSADICEKVPAA